MEREKERKAEKDKKREKRGKSAKEKELPTVKIKRETEAKRRILSLLRSVFLSRIQNERIRRKKVCEEQERSDEREKERGGKGRREEHVCERGRKREEGK